MRRDQTLFLALIAVPLGCSSSHTAPPASHTGSTLPDAGNAGPIDGGATSDGAALDAGPLVTTIPLPGGPPGIGFDDLRLAPVLGRILAPGGRTGNVYLVDPDTLAVEAITGFSASAAFTQGSHGNGSTSADEGGAAIFAIDHETTTLRVVDSATRATTASAPAAADPDYARYVAKTNEVWLTEPLTGIEVFSLPSSGAPRSVATISIPGGPEAIVVDGTRGRVYTNSFVGQTYAVDVQARTISETWKNGCAVSLGLALDEARGFLFVACSAGSVVVLDVANGGTKLGEIAQGAGLDILSYDPHLNHLYVQGGTSGDLGIVAVSSAGEPSLLGTVVTASSSTSTTDERGHVFVGDPEVGALLRVRDTYPATP